MLCPLRLLYHVLAHVPSHLRGHEPAVLVYVGLPRKTLHQGLDEQTAVFLAAQGFALIGSRQHLHGTFFCILFRSASSFERQSLDRAGLPAPHRRIEQKQRMFGGATVTEFLELLECHRFRYVSDLGIPWHEITHI